jgi:hypothetical protein
VSKTQKPVPTKRGTHGRVGMTLAQVAAEHIAEAALTRNEDGDIIDANGKNWGKTGAGK